MLLHELHWQWAIWLRNMRWSDICDAYAHKSDICGICGWCTSADVSAWPLANLNWKSMQAQISSKFYKVLQISVRPNVCYIWVKFLRAYRAWIWCHIFCIFEHLFRQFRGVLHQNIQHFLKIYECQIVYIPLFWPVVHWGPVQLPIHFTLHQKIVVLQNMIYSLFSPVIVFLSHIIDRYDVQGYPVCLEGH